MTRKITYEEVRAEFEKRGYVLIETEYKNAHTKMKYKCSSHPEEKLFIRYNNLQRGQGCKYCGSEKTKDKLLNSFDEIKRKFEECGYILLETEYIGAHSKMKYVCPKHPTKELSISWNNLNSGKGCPHCANRGEITYEDVKLEFEKRGYKLLENKYVDNKTPMSYLCSHHPDKNISIRLNSLKAGRGCPYCAGVAKYTFKEVKLEFEKRDYKLLEAEYVGANTKMKYKCPKHPNKEQRIKWSGLQQGRGCRFCANEAIKGEKNPNWKGGISSLKEHLRSKILNWKKDSSKNCVFKCVVTGGKFDVIHHLYGFDLIIKEVLMEVNLDVRENVIDYTDKELKSLEDKCLEVHYRYPLGVCLREDIHYLFHREYGKGENTPEQFEEFKQRWDDGEFVGLINN